MSNFNEQSVWEENYVIPTLAPAHVTSVVNQHLLSVCVGELIWAKKALHVC